MNTICSPTYIFHAGYLTLSAGTALSDFAFLVNAFSLTPNAPKSLLLSIHLSMDVEQQQLPPSLLVPSCVKKVLFFSVLRSGNTQGHCFYFYYTKEHDGKGEAASRTETAAFYCIFQVL